MALVHSSDNSVKTYNLFSHDERISWGGIILASLVAIGLSFLINLVTAAIGLSVFTLNTEGQVKIVLNSYLGLLIVYALSMILTGYIAGALVKPAKCWGMVHGFAAWCLAMLVLLAFFSQPATKAVGTSIQSLNSSLSVIQLYHLSNEIQNTVSSNNLVDLINKTGLGLLTMLTLLSISALSSCFGGYLGARDRHSN